MTRPDTSSSAIVRAIQERLPGCEVQTDGKGVIVVKNIDRFLNLGPYDKWISMNWFLRETHARISIANSSMLVADIEQRPSANYGLFALVCLPFLCVGWIALAGSVFGTYWGKAKIQGSVQRLLADIAK